jgi:sulfate transport system substrate-binding protein
MELPRGVRLRTKAIWRQRKAGPGFVGKIFANVPVFDTGARGATVTFLQRGIGDVLVAWENEAILAAETMGKGQVEIIYPSVSIRAEPPVAIVDRNAKRRNTEKAAADYLTFLYSDAGQEVIAKHHFRPQEKRVADKYKNKFPALALFTVDEVFGGWAKAHKAHFADGGTFDRIQKRK